MTAACSMTASPMWMSGITKILSNFLTVRRVFEISLVEVIHQGPVAEDGGDDGIEKLGAGPGKMGR